MAAFWRRSAPALADLVRPLTKAALDFRIWAGGSSCRWSGVAPTGRCVPSSATYSDRELMTDLHLTRSEIDDVAAEGADERWAAYIAADPRPAAGGPGLEGALHRAPG